MGARVNSNPQKGAKRTGTDMWIIGYKHNHKYLSTCEW